MTKNCLTIKEVANLYGIKDYQVRYAIRAGYIKSFKKGWMVLIKKKALPKKWPTMKGAVGR